MDMNTVNEAIYGKYGTVLPRLHKFFTMWREFNKIIYAPTDQLRHPRCLMPNHGL